MLSFFKKRKEESLINEIDEALKSARSLSMSPAGREMAKLLLKGEKSNTNDVYVFMVLYRCCYDFYPPHAAEQDAFYVMQAELDLLDVTSHHILSVMLKKTANGASKLFNEQYALSGMLIDKASREKTAKLMVEQAMNRELVVRVISEE